MPALRALPSRRSFDAVPRRATLRRRRHVPRHRGRELADARRRGGGLRGRAARAAGGRDRHRAHPGARRGAARPALSPARRTDPRERASRLGRRRALQPALPPAARLPAGAGRRAAAEAARRPRHGAAARSPQAALGAVGRGGAGRRPLRDPHEDPSLHDRRRRQCGPDGRLDVAEPDGAGAEAEALARAPRAEPARAVRPRAAGLRRSIRSAAPARCATRSSAWARRSAPA
jgi:hypothetical protein